MCDLLLLLKKSERQGGSVCESEGRVVKVSVRAASQALTGSVAHPPWKTAAIFTATATQFKRLTRPPAISLPPNLPGQ